MDFTEKFKKIKEKFKSAETINLTTDFAIQVNMTDEDCGGIFYIANIGGVFSVEPYDYIDHTAMITAKAIEFEKLIGRRIGFDTAVNSGKIVIDGNTEHVKIMTELFPKPVRKSSAKKEVKKKNTKKDETKKSTNKK